MLYTADLICWGVASPEIFQSFLSMLERKSREQVSFYAHRGSGIRPNGDEVATFADGRTETETVASRVWQRIWYDRLCRESCYRCGYHSLARPGDLTIGDWWGLSRYMPELEDPWGVSCAIANTPRGLSLLQDASSVLELSVTPPSAVANSSQPMLLHPPARNGRDAIWPELYTHGFEAACRSVGALGPMRAVKDFVRKKLIPLNSDVHRDDGEVIVDEAWKRTSGVDFDELLARGEYPVAFAARNRDDGVRRTSSSGGMYHALASHVINGLSGVVYGCAFDEELRAVHIRCESMAEAERCMGSKYSQSDMGDSIRQVCNDLKAGRTVLFTGTPCQVAAVRAASANVRGGATDC